PVLSKVTVLPVEAVGCADAIVTAPAVPTPLVLMAPRLIAAVFVDPEPAITETFPPVPNVLDVLMVWLPFRIMLPFFEFVENAASVTLPPLACALPTPRRVELESITAPT